MLGGRNDFYIGERHTNVDGVEVYSWKNPIACTFYRKNHQHDGKLDLGDLCSDVVVIRSFGHGSNGQISDFEDDNLVSDPPARPFPKRGLVIPAAPRRPVPQPKPEPRPAPQIDMAPSIHSESDERPKHGEAAIAEGEGIRAESLLRAQLHAPRTVGLTSVLSTLQAEQYELITVPAMDSMVIEGQPGTGKTIIASHRAAYVTGDETPPENSLDGKVLIVGPTPEYSRHIWDVVSRLADNPDRVLVLSVPELMQRILGANREPRGPASNSWQDVEVKLGQLSGSVITRHRSAQVRLPTVETVYECLRANAAMGRPITQDIEWAKYLRALPPYKQALTLRAHWPLLASITWEINRPVDLRNVEHIIVDEAQDVSEMEWFLLQAINEAHAWTILGDLNQRRSDHTHASWKKILDVITVDVNTPIRRLTRGYRSTKPILEYANKLLPRDQRAFDSFQHGGVPPNIAKTNARELGDVLLAEIDRLISNYPTGTVAVITVKPEILRSALRGQGWRTISQDMKRWQRNGAELAVLEPDSARGLEFDGVIVVEPADFPTNYGRQGPLYTALTRANRELSVVHSRSLPDSLRRR
jgi:DNA helicase IV